MPPSTKRHATAREPDALLALMDRWAQSWAGVEADKPVGRALVGELRPFIVHLHNQGLAAKTLRRHLDNLWVIGGEIVRELNYDSKLRNKTATQLLLDAIEGGEAPYSMHATEAEQRSLDATARKLLRYLTEMRPPR